MACTHFSINIYCMDLCALAGGCVRCWVTFIVIDFSGACNTEFTPFCWHSPSGTLSYQFFPFLMSTDSFSVLLSWLSFHRVNKFSEVSIVACFPPCTLTWEISSNSHALNYHFSTNDSQRDIPLLIWSPSSCLHS